MNLFELYAKLGLDSSEFDKGINSAKSTASAAGKAIAVSLTAAVTAISAVVGKAVSEFGEYEQLVGGVDTLFKNSSQLVQQYAESAYYRVGLSANDYMQTVTSFSARLLQGLGEDTDKAAEIADMAMVDMADNANKMGTAMSSIQNAYQGFAKQNYTMLDNLKLGYGGTASEMARLINDSGVLGKTVKVTADTVNSVSFDKIIEAIHVIQEEMGITGTTSIEAAGTIQGSLNTVKASWENFLVGLGRSDADVGGLAKTLLDSLMAVANNITPVVKRILTTMVTFLQENAPGILEQIIDFIVQALPELATSVVQLAGAIIQTIADNIGTIADAAIDLVGTVLHTIADNADKLVENVVKIVVTLIDKVMDSDSIHTLQNSAVKLTEKLVEGVVAALPELLQMVMEVIANSLTQPVTLLNLGLKIAWGIAKGLIKGIATWISPDFADYLDSQMSDDKFNDILDKATDEFINNQKKSWYSMPSIKVSGGTEESTETTDDGIETEEDIGTPIQVQLVLDDKVFGEAVVKYGGKQSQIVGKTVITNKDAIRSGTI